MASAMWTKCSKNFEAMSSYTGSVLASSSAIDSIVRQKKAIQAVPSACSRKSPVRSGFERSKTPMLSSPRKPPENRLRPAASLRLTHQVKLRSSFWNIRAKKARSRWPSAPTAIL